MVVVGGALFAVNGTVSKLILQAGVDAPHLTVLRASGASVGLLILVVARGPGAAGLRALRVTRRELPLLVTYGLVGFLVVPMLYFIAIKRLPVGIGLLFEYTAPLLVALWARFGQRQRVKPRLWLGLTLSLVGLAAVAQIWQTGPDSLDPVGVAAGFGAAALLAVYYLLGPHFVAKREATVVTCWSFGIAALAGMAIWPWWGFPFHVLRTSSHGIPVWVLAIYLVVCGSIIAYSLNIAALRHLPPTSVGIIGMIEPVLASAVAWLALGEALNLAQLLGGALILVGVALAETARTVGPGAPAAVPPT
jgi:drug/metabolite transporter (DMT)-like permease